MAAADQLYLPEIWPIILQEIDTAIEDVRLYYAAKRIRALQHATEGARRGNTESLTQEQVEIARRVHEEEVYSMCLREEEEMRVGMDKLNDTDGWTLASEDAHVSVSYREEVGTKLCSLLVVGSMPSSMENVMSIVAELDLYPMWVPKIAGRLGLLEANELLRVGKCRKLGRFLFGLPWPFNNREFVFGGFAGNMLDDEGFAAISLKSLDSFPGFELPPETKEIVRAAIHGVVVFVPVSDNETTLKMLVHVDLHMAYIPPSLFNFMSKQIIFHGFHAIRKLARNMPAQYAEHQKSNPELYEYIKREAKRFYEQRAAAALDLD